MTQVSFVCMRKKNYDCKRTLDESKDEELYEEGFTEEIVRRKSGSSLSGAVLYKKVFVAVLRRQMATSSSQGVLLSSQYALKELKRSVVTMHGQKTQRKTRERVMASRSHNV